jgi:CRISPR-associated protein Cas1
VNDIELAAVSTPQDTLRVSALHALAYCPRLFYLEEVEELYTQDAAVFAGRRLHVELDPEVDGTWENYCLESAELGLRGQVDALKTRAGQTIPYEHKRGRCYRNEANQPQAWESDKLQILAYACLLEAALGITIPEGRIRYHADNVLVHIPLDQAGRDWVQAMVQQARELRSQSVRPPINDNERLCVRCSLAPVCLPEEARLAHQTQPEPLRLFPLDDERQVLHVLDVGTAVGRYGEQLKLQRRGQPAELVPVRQLAQVVVHSFSQISTQALYLCKDQQVGVHWISGGGRYLGSFDARQGSIQRRIGQYRALTDEGLCLTLAKRLVYCRGQSQRKFLMRGSRKAGMTQDQLLPVIRQMQALLKQVDTAQSLASLLGLEGNLAALYFQSMPTLLVQQVPAELHFSGRNRRPPQDRFNALLSFGYALLLKDVVNAILTVGLEPALGFYHQPRSQASPLGLDLMEIFRVPLVDMPVIASINRQQWDIQADFDIRGNQIWLSDLGRQKFIKIYESRKQEQWKHPVTHYSLTYRRLIELEVRLLEKEWLGEGGLFANLVVR